MAFSYEISKAIDITKEHDEIGNSILSIDFKYVNFKLKLDDKVKTKKVIEILTGEVVEKKKEQKDVKIPKMYKG